MNFRLIVAVFCLLFAAAVDATRWRYALERHELSSLWIPFELQAGKCAMVADAKGYLYRICVGDYMGKNHGVVERIDKDGIRVREVFEKDNGDWEEVTSVVRKKSP